MNLPSDTLAHVFSYEPETQDKYLSSWVGHMVQNPACEASCAADGKCGCKNSRLSIFFASSELFQDVPAAAYCLAACIFCFYYFRRQTQFIAVPLDLPLDLT